MIEELRSRFESHLSSLNFSDEFPGLYRPLRYTINKGGKRIRPVLLLLSAEMFGARFEDAINQAIGVELFHNFTLIHDDIMDNAPLRRGNETVHKKWGPNTAILSGDVLFAISSKQVAQCEKEVMPGVMECFLKMAIQVCEGQQLDMEFENRDPEEGEYKKMIQLKTACLLAGSLKIGALLGKAERNESEAIYNFGRLLGEAFQLVDDYLDIFGNPEKFGKQVGGDILSGKKSFPYIQCLSSMKLDERKKFIKLYSNKEIEPARKIKAVTDVYKRQGIDRALNRILADLIEKANRMIKDIGQDGKAKNELINLSQQLSLRMN